jgi:signal transduction histidine kinase
MHSIASHGEAMKRSDWHICGIFFLVLLLGLLLSARSVVQAMQPITLTAEERAWLEKHPVIRLAPDPEFKPIEYFDQNGQYQGMAADHIRLLEKKLGITITIVQEKNWDEVLRKFKGGSIELLGAVVPTQKRSEFMLFSTPLFDVPGAIFTRKGSDETFNSVAALKKIPTAVVSNYTAHDILRNDHPDIPLVVVPDTISGLNSLSFGMAEAFVENVATASHYLHESAITNIRIAGTTDFKYRWSLGIRKDLPQLQEILDKGLAAITLEERQQINQRWIPLVPSGWVIQPRTLLTIVALLACMIAVIWNQSLIREIKERKKVEQELAVINETLEKRVAEAVEKCRVNDRIMFHQSRMAAMGEMIHSIAHQWRQPLNNIAIYVQTLELEHNAGELDGEQLHRNVSEIMDIIKFMSSTIDDFRTFFRQDKSKQPFLVSETVRKALTYMTAKLRQHNVHVETQLLEDSELNGFASQYIQVLLNIISNAVDALVKNQKVKPRIIIRIERQEDRSLVTVSDNAGGVPQELINHIFEPYFTTKDSDGGTGIGLYMAQNIIVNSMQGTLQVENNDEGAEFRIMV